MSTFSYWSDYTKRIWNCRYFWCALIERDLKHRYRGTVLGIVWSIIPPIALTMLLTIVFSPAFSIDRSRLAPSILFGLATWRWLTSAILESGNCFRFSEPYIRQVCLPTAIYPLRCSLSHAVQWLLTMLAGLVWIYGLGVIVLDVQTILMHFVSLLVSLCMLWMITWSLGCWIAYLSVRFADVPHLLEVIFQFLFYLTPVIYPPSFVSERGIGIALQINPIYHILEIVRQPLLEGQVPSMMNGIFVFCSIIFAMTLALSTVRKNERTLVFEL